jgi:polysaccharide export outer membrane protein
VVQQQAFVFYLMVVLGLSPCWTAQQPESQPETKTQATDQSLLSSPDYVIGPGDVLSIRIFQQPELGGDVKVSAQGYIRLLFIGEPIKAEGYTEWELADVIRKKYVAILRDPQVSVQVKEGRRDVAYILGSVKESKVVPWRPELRLLSMIAEAGGLTDRAGNVVYILRGTVWSANGQAENQNSGAEVTLTSVLEAVNIREMLSGRVELNKLIHPGDIISVPEADKVFVGGNVNTPNAFDLRGSLTLTQALTMAGGVKPASRRKVTIIRQEPGKKELTELVIDLGEVEKDRSKDIELQANDVVFVPASAVRNLGLALINSFAIQSALLPLYIIRR